MGPTAALLPCGTRLHLQHGPIDLIIGADGERQQAFDAARVRFETVLDELVAELDLLRTPLAANAPFPAGSMARRMDIATRPHASTYLTRMAAVAGAVADEILSAMIQAAALRRAYVNNGGDIAIHLRRDEHFSMAMAGCDGADLGRIQIRSFDNINGIATSGRHGRSLSFGIADSVTVLAENAAFADAAATLIANATDLPDHPAILRKPARTLQPDSDLKDLSVTVGCGTLTSLETNAALESGARVADTLQKKSHIRAAALFLNGACRVVGDTGFTPTTKRTPLHA